MEFCFYTSYVKVCGEGGERMINRYFDSPLFKYPKQLSREFWNLTPKAKYLLCKLNYVSERHFGKPVVVTCIYYKGGSGIHSQWRAFDIRTKDYYTCNQVAFLLDHFNNNFPYDPLRPKLKTLIHHKVDDKKIKDYNLIGFVPQYHLHCQVYIK